jgi:hypothetical protein
MNSLGQAYTSYPSKIEDLTYDSNGLLTKVKERDIQNKIVKDGLSNYTKYLYDNSKRCIEEYRFHYNYDKQPISTYDTKTIYKNINSQSITKHDGKPWMKIESTYNDVQKLIKQIDYSLPDNNVKLEQFFEYNNDSQISKYTRKTNSYFTECADRGNFTETYFYNDSKLIDRIIHKFDSVTCIMIFNYK